MGGQYRNPAEPPHAHVLPLPLYWGVFFALAGLTFLTVFSAQFDLGVFDIFVAMAIAVVKATLVFSIFMHLWWDEKLNSVILLIALVLMGVFLMFSVTDMNSRDLVDPVKRNFSIRDEMVDAHRRADPEAKPLRAKKNEWYRAPTAEEAEHLHDVSEAAMH